MSPGGHAQSLTRTCFPRVSGDEPVNDEIDDGLTMFSPRERG